MYCADENVNRRTVKRVELMNYETKINTCIKKYTHEPFNFIQITFMCVFSVCKLILMFTLFVYIFLIIFF